MQPAVELKGPLGEGLSKVADVQGDPLARGRMCLCSFISFRVLYYHVWYNCKRDWVVWGLFFLFFSNLSFCGVIIGVYRRNRFRYIEFVFFLWTRGLLCRLGCMRPHPLPTRSLQFPKPLEDSWGWEWG